jgi:formate dehydrogenase subunit beta
VDKLAEYFTSRAAIDSILQTLLREKIVDKVVSGETKKDWTAISPKLVDNPDDAINFPLSQFLVFNYDKVDTAANFVREKVDGAQKETVAIVGRPCDQRAIVELAKRLQVKKENIFLIETEDVGIVSVKEFGQWAKKNEFDVNTIQKAVLTAEKVILFLDGGEKRELEVGSEIKIQANCTRCSRKRALYADIVISTVGVDPDSDLLYIAPATQRGADVLAKASIDLTPLTDEQKEQHTTEMDAMIAAAKAQLKKDLEEWRALPQAKKLERLNKCSMCGMCINACPVCFCKDCVLQKKRKEGTIDNIAYQVTRVTHVGDSCIMCGRCALICPMNLPLDLYFATMNDFTCEEFNYEPGMEPDKPYPRSVKSIRLKAK